MPTLIQETLISQTAAFVAEHLERITARFYPLLFDRHPEVVAMFNPAHQRSGAQPRALARMVLEYVIARQDPRCADAVIAPAVHKHVSLSVRPEHYPLVGDCLLDAVGEVLGEVLGEPLDAEVAVAWRALYDELAERMIGAERRQYQALAASSGGWQGLRPFQLVARVDEADGIASFHLAPRDGGAILAGEPGQYLSVVAEIDGQRHPRQYSLTSDRDAAHYRISVRRHPQGVVSRYLHDRLEIGDTLLLSPPTGLLTLDQGDGPVVLISAGIGQTPMLGLAKRALAFGRRVVYLHGARDPQHHAFADETAALAGLWPERFTPVTRYSRGGDPALRGRIDGALLDCYLPSREALPSCYFVGPAGFMAEIERLLAERGVAEDRRRHEWFGASQGLAASLG
ncbi:FAD-binding oxidoreductase [Halotalea alkalilenta]|uniref:nitric oxide dioxygenase n=1 Tax=Halotalea alkalilenta TaxID=376489 RepID=A0A172YB40_9GAMM|nr:FAD-binding oxidoreductase [Halotalea alkalilenta]ANF56463.1 hypothetical protein A5892_02425 [Halotalea alkalilenta]